jgi:RNA polymerase-binding protein DksA
VQETILINKTKIKKLLEERQCELTGRIEEIDDDLREHEEDDSEERATEIAGDEVLEELGNASVREIQQIQAALVRLEKGTYGTCTRCGKKIGERRLQAIPEAALCITCAVYR